MLSKFDDGCIPVSLYGPSAPKTAEQKKADRLDFCRYQRGTLLVDIDKEEALKKYLVKLGPSYGAKIAEADARIAALRDKIAELEAELNA